MDTDEGMNHQLDNSLADGTHRIGKDGILQIATLEEPIGKTTRDMLEMSVTALPNTNVTGCITKKQLRELRRREESFNSK
jgi:hypothetical protein